MEVGLIAGQEVQLAGPPQLSTSLASARQQVGSRFGSQNRATSNKKPRYATAATGANW